LLPPIYSFLPGVGSGQAAIIGNTISRSDQKGFLILLGATNTLVMGFSFISLYLISRTRTGAAVAIREIIGIPSINIFNFNFICCFYLWFNFFFLNKKSCKTFLSKNHKNKLHKNFNHNFNNSSGLLSFYSSGLLIRRKITSGFFGLGILIYF